jgi:crotonobetainyl-CoA:carnitine CoA-transferase CaiB-like acyl-CoA transferase
MTNTIRPLEGIRVLEVGQLLAGPFAGTVLGYFGAEVIKIEPPGEGDPIRGWRMLDSSGTSYWWYSLARNKKSVTANLRSDAGRNIVRKLANTSDVLIENFKPGTMEKWGLGPEAFKISNPGLIYSRISGYGQTGPYAIKPGYASVTEGFSGFRHLNGFPGEAPVRPNLSIGDTISGLHAVIGILLALTGRMRSGADLGQTVDVALYESMFNLMEGVLPEFSGTGEIRGASGTTITGIVPTCTCSCADGKYVVIGGNGDSIFVRLMTAIGRTDIGNDPACANNRGRVVHQSRIDAAINAWAATLPAAEVIRILEAADVPVGLIYSIEDASADPHYRARGMFESVETPSGSLQIPAIVPRLESTPGRTDWAGPAVGAHTDAILASLGYTAAEVHNLRSQGDI